MFPSDRIAEPRPPRAAAVALAAVLAFAAGPALAKGKGDPGPRTCSDTAGLQARACRAEARDDLYVAKAVCLQVEEGERAGCLAVAREEHREARALCREQREAREAACAELGEQRYDPDFDPARFDADPRSPSAPNPWFPLAVGAQWQYAGEDETVLVEVTGETRLVDGVRCLVVRDRVEAAEGVVEDTDDWFALGRDGSVAYCGEISQNFETTAGDDPPVPELVDVEGSWKAGRDGALAGTQFLAVPAPGAVYRQEWAPGDAEDLARVLATGWRFGADPALDAFVPEALATLLCGGGDCVVTGEWTPLEPDAFERKYYAPGIGLFLEVTPEDGSVVQLVGCNVDPRCAALPAP